MRHAIIGLSLSALSLSALCMPARAADPDRPSFAITGYIWATAIDGKAATLPPLPAVDVNMNIRDVLKDLNGALMLAGEMRLGRWGFLLDGQYSQVTAKARSPSPLFSSAELRARSTIVQGSALYRLHEDAATRLDVSAGVRFWNLNNRLEILPGAANLRIDHTQNESWADPTVGVRLGVELGGPWSLSAAGDIGGFGVGSRFSWQALGAVNYAVNDAWVLKAGYRALYVDYRRGGYEYDATQHGPAVAVTYRF